MCMANNEVKSLISHFDRHYHGIYGKIFLTWDTCIL